MDPVHQESAIRVSSQCATAVEKYRRTDLENGNKIFIMLETGQTKQAFKHGTHPRDGENRVNGRNGVL